MFYCALNITACIFLQVKNKLHNGVWTSVFIIGTLSIDVNGNESVREGQKEVRMKERIKRRMEGIKKERIKEGRKNKGGKEEMKVGGKNEG